MYAYIKKRFNFLGTKLNWMQGINTKIRNRTFIRQTLTVHICNWGFNAIQGTQTSHQDGKETNMSNPQDKAVWHHLKVAVLNTLILKKCHRWLRHWKCTQHSEEAHYFLYFFFYSHTTRVLKGCVADKLDATAGGFCLSSKVTCMRCAFCNKPNDTQLVWLQGRWSKNNKCWSLISSLHHNQNPEKSRIQITPSEFGLIHKIVQIHQQ